MLIIARIHTYEIVSWGHQFWHGTPWDDTVHWLEVAVERIAVANCQEKETQFILSICGTIASFKLM